MATRPIVWYTYGEFFQPKGNVVHTDHRPLHLILKYVDDPLASKIWSYPDYRVFVHASGHINELTKGEGCVFHPEVKKACINAQTVLGWVYSDWKN